MKRVKYPKTFHFPWSENLQNDDRLLEDIGCFLGKNIVVSEKMDGECLDGSSLIQTKNGLLPIQDVCENKLNTEVLSYDINENTTNFKPIIDYLVEDGSNDEWFEIEMADGKTILLTGNHLVWCVDLQCYRRVDELTTNNELLLEN